MLRATLLTVLLAFPGAIRAEGLEAWLASLSRAESAFEAACEALRDTPAPPGLIWLRLGSEGVEIVPATPEAAGAAAFWAESALGARAAALALYGQADGEALALRPVMIETGPEGVAIHDGGEKSHGDSCDALRRLPAAIGGGTLGGDPFGAVRAAALAGLAAPIGGEVSSRLPTPVPPGARVRGPDGVAVELVPGEEGEAHVSVAVSGDATPGEALLRIYGPEDPFRPVQTLPLRILPGADPVAPPKPGALALGGRTEGRVGLGQAARLSFAVAEPGRFTFASAPGLDLSARLEGPEGEPITGDDDSGSGYGFHFSVELKPGDYHLTLSHCCGGGGHFSVTSATE